MPNRRHLALVVAGAIALLCPRVADADSSEADRRLRAGLEAYQQGEYDRAIRSFHAGYAAEPRREFLFAIAQAERLRGDCAAAIVYYRRFLSRNPPARQVEAAIEQLEHCQQAQSSGPAASRGDREKREVRPVPTPARSVESRSPADWYRDPIAGSLLAGGAGLLIAAGTFYLSADAASDAARRAESYPEFDRQASRASSRQGMAIGLTVAGSALVGGAIYRYVIRSRSSERAPAAGLALTPGGGVGLAVGGRF